MRAHTVEEASKSWCPMSRVFVPLTDIRGNMRAAISANRPSEDPDAGYKAATCLSSGCMMWRWAMVRNPNWEPQTIGMALTVRRHPEDIPREYIDSTTHGYCGLAGRP
jgi:hypothetical protein